MAFEHGHLAKLDQLYCSKSESITGKLRSASHWKTASAEDNLAGKHLKQRPEAHGGHEDCSAKRIT